MKNNYQLIVWKNEFIDEPLGTIDEVVSHYIDWHKGCNGSNCKAEMTRGYEILEDCGGCIP